MSREIYRRYGFDKWLFAATVALLAFGLVMVFSASAPRGLEEHQNALFFFIHQAIGAAAGIGLLLLIMSWPKPFYKNAFFIYGMLTLSVGLLALALVMPEIKNTHRWIHFLSFRFQPSEMAKISLVLFLAHYLDKKSGGLHDIRALAFPLTVIGTTLFLILKEPDLSTTLLIFVICAGMFFLGGVRLSHFMLLGLGFLGVLTAVLVQAPLYMRQRISSFLSPDSNLLSTGYQALQSKLALGSGGVFGLSIGQSKQKLYFLPDAHTDYIFSIVGEELGLLGALGVLFLFGVFIWRGLIISRRAPDHFSRLLAAGITLAVGIQALLNISIAAGLAPTTGLPLPLFSFGRSSLISTTFAVGLLLHISQRKTTLRRK